MQRKIIPGTPLLLSGLLVLSSCGAQKHVAVSDPAFDYSTSFPATQHLPKEFSGIRYRAEIVGYGPDGKQVKVIQVSPDYALAAFGGVLLGRDGGEWGGELVFRKRDGTVQRILEQDVHGIFQMPFGVAVFTGLAHLHANHGRLYVIFRNQRGTISARLRQSLPGAPSDVFRTTEGDLVFRILSARFKRQGGFLTPVKDCYLLKKSGIVMALSCSAVAKAPSPK